MKGLPMVVQKEVANPLGCCGWRFSGWLAKAVHYIIIARYYSDQNRQFEIGSRVGPSGIAPKLHRRAKAFLYLGEFTFPIDSIDFIEHEMTSESEYDRPRFVDADFKIVRKANHKSNQARN